MVYWMWHLKFESSIVFDGVFMILCSHNLQKLAVQPQQCVKVYFSRAVWWPTDECCLLLSAVSPLVVAYYWLIFFDNKISTSGLRHLAISEYLVFPVINFLVVARENTASNYCGDCRLDVSCYAVHVSLMVHRYTGLQEIGFFRLLFGSYFDYKGANAALQHEDEINWMDWESWDC